jgi:hypothetical protein
MLLAKDGEWKTVDLGLIHSSAAPSIAQLIIERLGQVGDVEDKGVSPRLLVSNWPPAFKEWNLNRPATRFSHHLSFRASSTPTRSRTRSRAASRMGCSANVGFASTSRPVIRPW